MVPDFDPAMQRRSFGIDLVGDGRLRRIDHVYSRRSVLLTMPSTETLGVVGDDDTGRCDKDHADCRDNTLPQDCLHRFDPLGDGPSVLIACYSDVSDAASEAETISNARVMLMSCVIFMTALTLAFNVSLLHAGFSEDSSARRRVGAIGSIAAYSAAAGPENVPAGICSSGLFLGRVRLLNLT